MAERFYATQVSAWTRILWGIGAVALARHEFRPPADVIGGIILTLIALWCFITAGRIAWLIGRIKVWP